MLTATTPTEAALDIEALKKAFEDFDLATLLPNLDSIFGKITLICRICVLVGPILLLVLGLSYLFWPPRRPITTWATAAITAWAASTPGASPSALPVWFWEDWGWCSQWS